MNRGIYPILSGAIAQEQRLEVVANNVANAQTNGYKKDEPLFRSILSGTRRGASGTGSGHHLFAPSNGGTHKPLPHAFVRISEYKTEMAPGRLLETKNNLHAAIQGDGFFEIKTSQGLRYTKNGRFRVDEQRHLVTVMGDPVMGSKGEIKLPPGEAKITADGNVTVEGKPAGSLKIVEFAKDGQLTKTGDGLFIGKDPTAVKAPSLTVGYIEQSNVNSLEEMIKVISTMRNFEAAQKMIAAFDQMTQATIQEVGRVV